MSIILGQTPSSAASSTPCARGTHLQKLCPLGKFSITIRLPLQSSSRVDCLRGVLEAVSG